MLDVNAWMLACPRLLSFIHLVSTLKQNIAHCLVPVVILAFVDVSLVNGMEIGTEADLICTLVWPELITLCMPMRGKSSFPNLTTSLKRSLLCLVFSQKSSYCFLSNRLWIWLLPLGSAGALWRTRHVIIQKV